ncbi:MAG TPA: amino acid ABC transporter permease [Actinomycetota bacterium]|nr:amino acid ABC transporter permease [Actinomycetota bacterium]
MAEAAVERPQTEPAVERPQREPLLRSQTGLSLATFLVGAAALAIPSVGSIWLLLAGGLTPSDQLVATINSPTQGLILWLGVALGGLALTSALFFYRYMPTKRSREAIIVGGALGGLAILLSAIYLLFRTGDPEIFVRNFLDLEQLRGLGEPFLRGALNTLILAFGGELLGIVIGLTLAMLVLSKRAVIRAPARLYINFFRGTPLLWQLLFISTVMIVGFGLFRRDPYPVAIIILGLNAGGYSAEIFRAGIQSVERGQLEAARSLGMSYGQAMRYAILPQAIRRVIPPLMNEFVILIKDTSLVAVLGLTFVQRELLAAGRDAVLETGNSTAYLGTALGYLVVTLPLIRLVTWAESKLRSGLVGVTGA